MAVPAAVAAPRLELWLVIDPGNGDDQEIAVEVASDCPVGELVAAIASHLALAHPEAAVGVRRRSGTVRLDPHAPVSGSGLRSGDVLLLHERPPEQSVIGTRSAHHDAPPEGAVTLSIAGGPAAGQRLTLAPGEHTIGRDPAQASIRIDDPSLSRVHLQVIVTNGVAAIADAGSANGTFIDGIPLVAPRPLHPSDLVRIGRTLIRAEPAALAAVARSDRTIVTGGTVPFNRPPRVRRPAAGRKVTVPNPPDEASAAKIPIISSLVPLVAGVGMWLLLKNAYFLLFTAMAPFMALGSFVEDRRSGKGRYRKKLREWRANLDEIEAELIAGRGEEAAAQRAQAPDAAALLQRAVRREPELWERRPDHDDFLALRLGSGSRTSSSEIRFESGGEEKLRKEGDERVSAALGLVDVPVLADIRHDGPLGLCGPRAKVDATARWLLVQAATLHSPRDLVITAAIPDDPSAAWSWLRWLPHVQSPAGGGGAGSSPVEHAHLVDDHSGAAGLVKALQQVITIRQEDDSFNRLGANLRSDGGVGGRGFKGPSILAVIDERIAPDKSVCSALLAAGPEVGVYVIWMGFAAPGLPGECRAIAELEDDVARVALTLTRTGVTHDDVCADGVDVDLAREAALALAPVKDVSAAGAAGQVPRRLTLFEGLGVAEPIDAWVLERWRRPPEGRTATLGAATQGPLSVDLRADGPHALIGGTTGAGKSELLQTLVASLAATYPPERLTFLLIDYKGGAAFKDCIALPHVVGFVTDLDAHLTNRALTSLNAELKAREHVLRDAGARDQIEMERTDPDNAPPSLVIVVDEFATLVKEVPEFVDGVVDVAQRGRSLGVHLVLATQRPAGAVSENIRANVNLRIALRMSDNMSSSDVIGEPDAARIPRSLPGRAFVRTGPAELVEFQTAFAAAVSIDETERPPVIIRRLNAGTVAQTIDLLGDDSRGVTRPSIGRADTPTDLERVVEGAVLAFDETGRASPSEPWLPALPHALDLARLRECRPAGAPSDSVALLGLIDEPDLQRQSLWTHDFERDGSLLVFGAGASGKTVLLRTIAASLAQDASPAELQLYGMDFASQGLTAVAELPHCGTVIAGEDEERVRRLFGMLRKAIDARRARFAQLGAFSLSEYRAKQPEVEAGGVGGWARIPRIVVLFDGYAGFVSHFDKIDLGALVDMLPRLVADGRSLGIHFVVTADRRGGMPGQLTGTVPSTVVLRMANDDEYSLLAVDPRTVRDRVLPPGRGFVRGGRELQAAIVGGDPSGTAQVRALGDLAQALRQFHAGAPGVPEVGILAHEVPRASLPPGTALEVPLGLGDANLAPVAIDLADGHCVICGPYRSGRSTALGTLALALRAMHPAMPIHLLAPRRSPLLELDCFTTVNRGEDACVERIRELAGDAAGRTAGGLHPVVAVFVDDGDELSESLASSDLETLVKRGRDVDMRLIVGAESQSVLRAYGGYLRELRKDEQGMLLNPDMDVDGDILGVRLPRRTNPTFPAGRGYLVRRGNYELVQVAS